MKKFLTILCLLCAFSAGAVLANNVLPVDPSKYTKLPGFLGYKSNEVIVVLKNEIGVDHARDMSGAVALDHLEGFPGLAQRFNVQRLRPQFIGSDRPDKNFSAQRRALARHYKVYFSNGDLDEVVAAYSALPQVERVEKIGIHTVYATPNDTYYDNPPPEFPYDQWHYWDTYGIEADQAWDMETGDQTVLVGDLDIGTMYDHGDLGGSNPPGPNDNSTNGNIWINTNETPGNGIDDDGNGYVDDILGWDFVERTDWYSYACIDIDCGGADNDPSDGDGHGTHTAGTIAAISNNGYCVAGVAGGFGDGTYSGGGNGVKVVPCRIGYVLDYWIYGATGVVIMDYVAEAMYYMGDLKAAGWNVAAINCSFGTTNSGGLGAACDYLISQDVVVCVAAGNSSSSTADYLGSRGDCLDVGATDVNGDPASFTNYGSWVDIAAPGVEILSTITDPADPGVDYIAAMDGTSMSCPHVAGVVGLLESYNPTLSATDKINIITDPANTKPYNGSLDLGAGIVDAYKCLQAAGGGCDLAADFSGSPTTGCAGMTVNFTDLSTGTNIDGWSWTFGDGGTSTAQNPSYTYNTAGTYTVSLTVSSSSQGCNDTQTKTGYITVNPFPVADFSGSPTTGTEPLTVNFTDLSTDATGWSWDFGDGVGTSTAQNPSYTYNSAGTYTVTLTASNACGSDQEVKVDYITVDPCLVPVADFVGSPTSGEVPLQVSFTDQSTNNPTSWSWDFGDGIGTSTQQNPSYTYNDAGTYTVTLTASNSCGSDQVVKTDYITVTCTAPVADFSGTPTTGDAPLTVDFTDLSTGATSWSWDFGDGVGTSTQQNPSYTYNDAGTYTVTLTATNSCGSDQVIKTDYITVTCTAPVADFSGTPTTGYAPLTVDFTDLSTNATSWSWDFGDGVGTSTQQNPSYTYNDPGTYTVSLTATNACGSDIATKIDYITVDSAQGPTQVFAVSDIPVIGTVSGDYTATNGSDNVYETITEVEYTGHPRKRYSYLEHKWTFNLGSGGDNMVFYLETYRPANTDGDDFVFAYSTDDATYYNMVTVASGTEQVYSYTMPAGVTGTVYVRVIDTDRNWGLTSLDPVYVDQMYFEFSSQPGPPVADFVGDPTSGIEPLTVNFTDASTGDPTSWSWDFGDGVGTSTVQNPSYTYNTAGTYTVELTASNAYGSDTETKVGYITVSAQGQTMHVSDITVSRKTAGPNCNGQCYVTIVDGGGAPVANATVYTTATGPVGGTYSAATDASGVAFIETGKTKDCSGEWCFEVTDITHSTYTYNSADNAVTKACESGWVYSAKGQPDQAAVPDEFSIGNYPNPFNPSTVIAFALPNESHVRLDIYNILGQKVTTLVNEQLSAGEYSYEWDGSKVASGIYLYRLTTDKFSATRKMVLMK